MAIGYLVSQFPKPSETFVSRELLALSRLGLELMPFAFDRPSDKEVLKLDPPTRGMGEQVRYLSGCTLVGSALGGLPGAFHGWRDNLELQQRCTIKSNLHMRQLRVVALARQLKQAGVGHLHAHWPYATQVAYLVHKLTGISFSVSIHAHEVEHDHGHFPKVFESLSFATFCNRAAMDRLLSRLPAAARDRSHLIYHGVDLGRFSALPFPGGSGPLKVISAGRLTKSKGFDRLLRACAACHGSGAPVHLTILGQGPEEQNLRLLAESLGFTGHLSLPGWLPHDQVAERLAQAHVFALLADTNFHDGLPNVVLEAMASGRPVILSPLPAAAEAVTDGVEGFILPSCEEQACALLLRQLAARPGDLEPMGLRARRRMEQGFDEAVHVRQLKRLFEQVNGGAV